MSKSAFMIWSMALGVWLSNAADAFRNGHNGFGMFSVVVALLCAVIVAFEARA